jgi:putative membrane protein
MVRFLIQVVINAIALWVAVQIVGGATISSEPMTVLLVALIFGALNSLVRPILSFFTCPFYVLTLGLFTFVMNVFILWLLEWIAVRVIDPNAVGFGDFWNTLLVGLIVSAVSFGLSLLFGTRDNR